jgi:hypothetical protein
MSHNLRSGPKSN